MTDHGLLDTEIIAILRSAVDRGGMTRDAADAILTTISDLRVRLAAREQEAHATLQRFTLLVLQKNYLLAQIAKLAQQEEQKHD